nr:PREDICTED: probable dolichyl pyrophosphate Glc1Man9GlcNAc2 alpha-1,3-glucosyltransferase isoform X1 [Musa acuminata subsp. malaccensis]
MGGGDGPLFLVPSLWSHGLLIVDYIHFRYNGYLLGFLLLFPLSLLEEGKDLAGGLILPVPFCFFHHFFVHLLRHHCRRGPWEASRRFLTMGIAVSTVSPRRSVHSCSMSRCNRYIVVYFHLAGVMHADWASHFGQQTATYMVLGFVASSIQITKLCIIDAFPDISRYGLLLKETKQNASSASDVKQ